jgi:hypothetical protein
LVLKVLKNNFMERLIRINSEIVEKRPGVDRFAVQKIFNELGVKREYFINGDWTSNVSCGQVPDKRRFSLSREDFSMARNTYNAWKLLTNNSISDPVNKEEIMNRIMEPQLTDRYYGLFDTLFGCKFNFSLNLFIPWGVRALGTFGDPEIQVLDKIKILSDRLKFNCKVRNKVLIMPADIYATEVNNIDPELVGRYFSKITAEAESRGFEVEPWSTIRAKNRQRYEELANRLDKNEIKRILSPFVIDSAMKAAKKRSNRTSSEDIENAAFAYLRERMCEADIIEETRKPVKVSAVAKNKDNEVDRALPRVYLIPPEEQFPWLKQYE